MRSLLPLLLVVVAAAAQEPKVTNGGFEAAAPGQPAAGWTLGDPPLLPQGWTLNTAYPGELRLLGDAPEGERFLRLTAPDGRAAHVYQQVPGLVPDRWHRVTVSARGGLQIMAYEYGDGTFLRTQMIIDQERQGDDWRTVSGYYLPGGEGFDHAALAIAAAPGQTVDIDDLRVEPLLTADAPAGEPMVFRNESVEWAVDPAGRLVRFVDLASGRDYAVGGVPWPLVGAVRDGRVVPLRSLTREGDALVAQFIEPDVSARLRVIPGPQHFLIEIFDVQPADLTELALDFPVRRLEVVAYAPNATYDAEFGAALFGGTVNVRNVPVTRSAEVQSLRSACYAAHGLVGAQFVLVAAPGPRFFEAIREGERAAGLPSPELDGEWARLSQPVRQSYLFATQVVEDDLDALLEYAKIGGFRTFIILKNDWLANHGHYEINTKAFPGGDEGFGRAVAKIHAAGLDAGVHVFGPSVSPDDPYVTPVPDDRLAALELPPLAEAVDAAATTITLSGPSPLPLPAEQSRAYPGRYLRVGDEIMIYSDAEPGPPFRYTGVRRGALGTQAAAHPAGAPVKGLLALWNFPLVDPDSTLLTEMADRFAELVNGADLDMVYFDAAEGYGRGIDGWYASNKAHLEYYRRFDHDVLYQTSQGTGRDILWHLVPRSASADGHGDIKGYLDQRWPAILGMGPNLTRADIGWYYWFRDVRPDQIEYVCAKAAGVDGSVSVETSREALERLTQSRQMMEMFARWENARLGGWFTEPVREKLREVGADFRLFGEPGAWQLWRAAYEEPRSIHVLGGGRETWALTAEQPVQLGVELVRDREPVAVAGYQDEDALTIETFDDAAPYAPSERNNFEKYAIGADKQMTPTGPVRAGVTQTVERVDDAHVGDHSLRYVNDNRGEHGGWGGIGRRFAAPLDLSGYAGLGLWVKGDGEGEMLRIQLRDSAGRSIDFTPTIGFSGWRLLTFPFPANSPVDRSAIEYLLFYFNNIPARLAVEVQLDDVKALRSLDPAPTAGRPVLVVDGRRIELPVRFDAGQAITVSAPGGATLWSGGMAPGQPIEVDPAALALAPGEHTVGLSWEPADAFPGDVTALVYRMWPVEE